jgi:dihydrofolate reductase
MPARLSLPGSRIASGDLGQELAPLRNQPGGEIMAHGGASFVQALSRHVLIDEYRLVILPVALGNGLPLFKDLAKPLRLGLAQATSSPTERSFTSTNRRLLRADWPRGSRPGPAQIFLQ